MKVVQKIIDKLPVEEIEKVRTITGLVVLIGRLIDKIHKKKKLSYQESKLLTGLVIDTLIVSLKDRNINQNINNLVEELDQNRYMVEILVSEMIDIWHGMSGMCQKCCPRKESRVRQSIVEKKNQDIVKVSYV